MAPGRIVVVPCAPRAPRGALRATGYLSHTSAADVAARLGFAPQRRMWAFRVCGVDFAVWAEKGSEAYGVFATSAPSDFFAVLVAGTHMRHEACASAT